jgi:hypothetical protein
MALRCTQVSSREENKVKQTQKSYLGRANDLCSLGNKKLHLQDEWYLFLFFASKLPPHPHTYFLSRAKNFGSSPEKKSQVFLLPSNM